jgi:hypothetical protein
VPWARYEVDFIAEHFAEIASAERPTAIALYVALVDVSTKMLLDGRISAAVLHACADECGIAGVRRTDRLRARSVTALVHISLLSADTSGGYVLTRWREHHRSRHDVTEERKAAAERKRKSRTQPQLDLSRPKSHRDVTDDVTARQSRDSRVRIPAGAVTETENLDPEPLLESDSSGLTKHADLAHAREPAPPSSTLEVSGLSEVLRDF